MKKFLSVILAAAMCVCFTACGKSADAAATESTAYAGILTKVKLGMPLEKIVSLQPDGVDLYYEDDKTVWGTNADTDLMEIKSLIPENDAFYYADDSIITYYFDGDNKDDMCLNGYSEEVHCLIDRETAEKYFETKTAELSKKHGVTEENPALGSIVGTEGMDMNLIYKEDFSASSYTVNFSMTLTYDTVNSVEGYYGTEFIITVTEKPESEKESVTLAAETTKK